MRNGLLPGLLVLAALLATVIFLEIADPPSFPATPTRTIGATLEEPAAHAAASDRTTAMVGAILARPLFEASRRAPTAAASAAAATAPVVPRLAGIIVVPDRRQAIFANPGKGPPLVLVEGDRVAGYVIQSIGAEGIVVVDRDGSRLVRPSFDPVAAKGAPPPPVILLPPPSSSPPARTYLPGLTGRPLGLVSNAGDAPPGAGDAK